MSQPILNTDPSDEDVVSIEFSGELGAGVTPPATDGKA